MGGGGPSTVTQTTTGPPFATKDEGFLSAAALQSLISGGNGYIPGLPQNALAQVAGLTPDQIQALNSVGGMFDPATALGYSGAAGLEGLFGASGGLTKAGTGLLKDQIGGNGFLDPTAQSFLTQQASGKFLNPATNPYLTATFNEAALPVTQAYETATAPGLMASSESAAGGGPSSLSGNSAFQQGQSLNEQNLGQTLNQLGTNIYGGAYQTGMQNALGAAGTLDQNALSKATLQQSAAEFGPNLAAELPGLLGATQSSLFGPSNALLQAGNVQQQQQQNVLDVGTQNALAQLNWPLARISDVASIVAGLAGGQGSVTGPNTMATSKL